MANVSNAPNDQIFQPHVSRGRRNDRPSLDNIYISGQITTGPKSKFISEAKLRNIKNASPDTKASNRLDVQEFRRYLEEDDNRKRCQERAGEEYSWLPRQNISSNEQYPGIHSNEC